MVLQAGIFAERKVMEKVQVCVCVWVIILKKDHENELKQLVGKHLTKIDILKSTLSVG